MSILTWFKKSQLRDVAIMVDEKTSCIEFNQEIGYPISHQNQGEGLQM